ncbi:MAG: hypothetical protein AAGA45_02925, partial [Verrucomicrobiota bacterium]
MVIHEEERRANLSVTELANFTLGPVARSGRGRELWRMQAGQAWHQSIQKTDTAANPNSQAEVTLRGIWNHAGWSLHLHGRIDQVIETETAWELREIKTVSEPLPLGPDQLLQTYPAYLCQLAAYVRLAQVLPAYSEKTISGELLFVELESGMQQRIALTESYQELFHGQVERLCSFLHERQRATQRRQQLSFLPAFARFRPEQKATLEVLHARATEHPQLLLEAPTGFGKTGLILQHALGQLRDGLYERIIYTTGKSTGQLQVVRQLAQMTKTPDDLRSYALRNRSEHTICSPNHTCDATCRRCTEDAAVQWERAALQPARLWESGRVDLERVRMLGAETGLCPYIISRSLLPHADVWVGDYHYVFSPWHRTVFTETAGYDPARTLLIVDEAHNLATRLASTLSFAVNAHVIQNLADDLLLHRVSPRVISALDNWLSFIAGMKETERLPEHEAYELRDQLDMLAELMLKERIPWDDLPADTGEQLSQLIRLHDTLVSDQVELLPWVPRRGELRLSALDTSGLVRDTLKAFGQTVLMSATLKPYALFCKELGLDEQAVTIIEAEAPWRQGTCQVAVDCRVDTRLKYRAHYYASTAQTVVDFSACDSRPTAVFFSSYAYAEAIRTYL